jgi:hypothetical protein
MKRFVALALLFCLFTLSPASDAQTRPKEKPVAPYGDSDGYQVLSSIIQSRTEKAKSTFVSIFYQTISAADFKEIRSDCLSRFPGEFQGALEDFDEKTKAKLLLQQQFSIGKQYKFVETPVGTRTGIYSVSAVGFDEKKTRAVALVQYLVRPRESPILGGGKTFYLLRRTETGWQEAADIPRCGHIY